MSETRTPSEWCSLLDWHILDPDGWREDGLSWFEPITREDFERRAAMSTARGPRAGSSVPEAARAAAIEAAERQVRYVKAIRWTDVAGNWDVEFAADRLMALADAEVAAAVAEERATTGRQVADAEERAEVFRDTAMQLYATIDRAVDAETELAALRERIEALAGEIEGMDIPVKTGDGDVFARGWNARASDIPAEIRALAADTPVGTPPFESYDGSTGGN